jgi:glutamyl/glutaminyl-tRNA synthetase
VTHAELAQAMLARGFFRETAERIPEAADRWIDLFLEAFAGLDEPAALDEVAALRAEATLVPALALERLRSRAVVFYLDAVSQYVDDQPELRGLPVQHDLIEVAREFGLREADALWAVRMALTGREAGAPLELLFPLLGHDRILIRIGAISSRLLHGRGLEPLAAGPDGRPFEPIAPDRQLAPGGAGLKASS